MALNFLISYRISVTSPQEHQEKMHLLERLVIHKTGGVFWNLQLPFLDMLAKLPGEASRVSCVLLRCEAGR